MGHRVNNIKHHFPTPYNLIAFMGDSLTRSDTEVLLRFFLILAVEIQLLDDVHGRNY